MSEFITKDSGKRQEFDSGMVRDTTEGKIQFDLALDGPVINWDLLCNSIKDEDDSLLSLFYIWYMSGNQDDAKAFISDLAGFEGGMFPFFKRYAELMTRGAVKYKARNWMQARGEAEYTRFRESALRHFFQYMAGDQDEDHAAAVCFNINGAEYVKQFLNQPTQG